MATFHRTLLLLSSCLLLLLGSCSTPTDQQSGNRNSSIRSRAGDTPESLLQQAESVSGNVAASLQIEAARLFSDSGNLSAATLTLNNISLNNLSNDLLANVLLARAEIADRQQNPRSVLNILSTSDFPSLTGLDPSLLRRFHFLRARAYQNIEAMLSSALERIQLDRLLDSQSQQENHEQIWEALGTIPISQLQAMAATAINYETRGWYELALIARLYGSDLDRQLVELTRWREGWTRHPAAQSLPTAMALVETLARERPQYIALLLPLDRPAGTIVRDAFMSAYYNLYELGGQVPEIKLYNTAQWQDMSALYQQALSGGAQLIIGPLLKEHVAQLHQRSDLSIPVLALNNIEGSTPASPLLFQFALSPEDEAIQLASKMWRDGYRRVAILNPYGETRKRNSFAFEFQRLGGTIAAEENYLDEYTESISSLLEVDQSYSRHAALNDLLNRETEFSPRRRQDIDSFFLIAEPEPGRQIVPSLAYLFAGDLPVYASQDIYSGLRRPADDRDLNGVTFADSPWLLGLDDTSVSRTRELFPQNSAQTLRLQAFGIDAFRLYPRLRLLSSGNSAAIPGASGILRIGSDQNIQRQLAWASIREGVAVTSE